ncbi:MAG: hypothetical protein ACK56I_31085, partial [bacterium]
PTEEELRKLSEIVEERVLSIVKKATILPKMNLTLLFSKAKYGEEEVKLAADLVNKMLRWVPNDRISAQEAINHPFLSGTQINL